MYNNKILHISNDFPNSNLYKQLVLHLGQLGIEQTVYSAVRTEKEKDYNPHLLSHLDLHIHNILHPHDRLLFRLKIRKIFNDLLSCIDIANIDTIHAHTLYSDGAVALKIKQNYNIPYIVTVRNTAINAFGKYRPDLNWRRDKILLEAQKIVFPSLAYRNKLLSSVISNVRESIIDKLITIPNGLDPYYLLNTKKLNKTVNSQLKLLFVGRFLKLKNIPKVIRAVEKLNNKIDISLTLVGGGGGDQERIEQLAKSKPYIDYLGVIKDRERLRKIYCEHDIFIMVSKPETFGLVYIEALSQGVPIIHTKGEGVDAYFEEGTVAEAVSDPNNIDEIAEKIQLLANRLDEGLRQQCSREAKRFDWSIIVEQYETLYKS